MALSVSALGDQVKENIFVLVTEENIWSICHFKTCQVGIKVHSVTLSEDSDRSCAVDA